jgi:hypothetical protein
MQRRDGVRGGARSHTMTFLHGNKCMRHTYMCTYIMRVYSTQRIKGRKHACFSCTESRSLHYCLSHYFFSLSYLTRATHTRLSCTGLHTSAYVSIRQRMKSVSVSTRATHTHLHVNTASKHRISREIRICRVFCKAYNDGTCKPGRGANLCFSSNV